MTKTQFGLYVLLPTKYTFIPPIKNKNKKTKKRPGKPLFSCLGFEESQYCGSHVVETSAHPPDFHRIGVPVQVLTTPCPHTTPKTQKIDWKPKHYFIECKTNNNYNNIKMAYYEQQLNFNRLWAIKPNEVQHARLVAANNVSHDLTQSIKQYCGIKMVKTETSQFNNGEMKVELCENVRGTHVFVVCSFSTSTNRLNDELMSLFLAIDACNRSDVDKVTVIMPYFPYARSDKKDKPHVPIAASIITRFLETLDVKNVISLDLHAAQLQALMSKGFHNLYAKNLICNELLAHNILSATNKAANQANYVFVAPDAGSIKRTEAYANAFAMNYVILHKQRDYSKDGTIKRSMLIADDPSMYVNKTAIIIDDIGDSMNTMISAVNELVAHGVKDAIIGLSHGVFSTAPTPTPDTPHQTVLEKINQCSHIKYVFITNSISQPPTPTTNKIVIIDIGHLLGCTIDGILSGKSVSSLII